MKLRSILTLAQKDLKLLFRDKFGLFWVLGFPLIYSLFFGAIFGGAGGGGGGRSAIPVAIVDEVANEATGELVERFADHSSLRVEREAVPAPEAGTETGAGAPVRHDLADAEAAVRKGDKAAYLRILDTYDGSPFSLMGDGGEAKFEIGIDPSRQAEAGFLQGILMGSVFGDMGDFSPSNDALRVVDVARDRSKEPRSAWEITFPQAVIWGLMSVAMGFAIMIVRERTQGTLLRLRIAPITRAELLAGKALGSFLTCILVILILTTFGTLVLSIEISSPLYFGLATLCTAACFTGIMMVAAVLGKTEQSVAGASWGLMMPFAMIGGGMIPLIAMPSWLLTASNFSPFKWGILAFEGAVWRGFELGDMLLPCGILLGVGAACFSLGVWIFGRMGD